MEKKFNQYSSSLWRQSTQQERGSPKLLFRSITFHVTLPSSSLKYLISIKNAQKTNICPRWLVLSCVVFSESYFSFFVLVLDSRGLWFPLGTVYNSTYIIIQYVQCIFNSSEGLREVLWSCASVWTSVSICSANLCSSNEMKVEESWVCFVHRAAHLLRCWHLQKVLLLLWSKGTSICVKSSRWLQ